MKSVALLRFLLRRAVRRLRVRLDDWRSDSRVAFGGPLDGQRLRTVVGTQRQYYYSLGGWLLWKHVPVYCEGAYELVGRRYEWQQWSNVYDVPALSDERSEEDE